MNLPIIIHQILQIQLERAKKVVIVADSGDELNSCSLQGAWDSEMHVSIK